MNQLVIAIPSKGRLKTKTEAIFSKAGFTVRAKGDERSYFGQLQGFATGQSAEIVFLSAAEIARKLIHGSIHFGITGEDLIRENLRGEDGKAALLHPLGFGHADVVVCVPESWIDVQSMADLDDVAASFRRLYGRRLRVATKYWNLTRNFFASHGLGTYRIVESFGATEGAPATGSADIIVDITSTGKTLRANYLKVLQDGLILRSQACLTAAKQADWDESQLSLAAELFSRIRQGGKEPGPDERANFCKLLS